MQLDDALGGSFGNSLGFERLEVRNGSWTVSSLDDFSEGGEVYSGATLINNGRLLGDLLVDSGARYAGSGRIGGDLTLASGATLGFAVSPSGAQAPIRVGGQASLAGAQLQVDAVEGLRLARFGEVAQRDVAQLHPRGLPGREFLEDGCHQRALLANAVSTTFS